tara:strand:+ start:1410 stop:1718 length:309 start_codon:yes stop_codon:yes gene_type:complete
MPSILYGQFESSTAIIVDRNTEVDDTRITELEDIRITEEFLSNSAQGTIVANPTLINLSVAQYIRISGLWTLVNNIYVKSGDSWVIPTKIYKNISGTWKRIK